MGNKVPMTPVMLRLLNFIKKYAKKNKYYPTYQEMADGLNYRSKNYYYTAFSGYQQKTQAEIREHQ